MSRLRVVITGASGFVGRHVVERLLSEQYELAALRKRGQPKSEFSSIKIKSVVDGDLGDPESIRSAICKLAPDAVVHLGSVIKGTHEEYRVINEDGTRALVNACVEYGVRRFIFLSSDVVMYNVASGYGDSKRVAEDIIRRSPLLWSILRPGWIYGMGDLRNLVPLVALIRKSPFIPIVHCVQQPIYVGDVVQAISGALTSESAVRKTYILAGGSVLDFAELVKEICLALGITRIICPVPATIMVSLVRLYERLVSNPVVSSQQIEVWLKHRIQYSEEATLDLGVRPTLFADGIRHSLVVARGSF